MRGLLTALFILVPLAELALIVWLGERIDYLNTIGLLLAVSIFGAVLAKREGLAAWRRFRRALGEGRVPSGEILDGALVLTGAVLLLTPGFITDAVGLVLLIPPLRSPIKAAMRRAARRSVDRRVGDHRDFYVSKRPRRVEVVKVSRADQERRHEGDDRLKSD